MTPAVSSSRLAILLLSSAVLLPAGATAQTGAAPSRVTPPGGQVAADQIGDAQLSVPQVGRVRDATGADQLSSDRRSPVASGQVAPASAARPGATQLTSERSGVQAGQQLSAGPASARAPDSPTRAADGRPGSVVRLAGSDRCDPQIVRTPPADCARVIETRSAEFERAHPATLSPEQRLLVEQRARESAGGTQSAIRRVANNSVDAGSADDQALASIVLAQPVPESKPASTIPTAAQDAANALVEALIQNGQITLPPPK